MGHNSKKKDEITRLQLSIMKFPPVLSLQTFNHIQQFYTFKWLLFGPFFDLGKIIPLWASSKTFIKHFCLSILKFLPVLSVYTSNPIDINISRSATLHAFFGHFANQKNRNEHLSLHSLHSLHSLSSELQLDFSVNLRKG